MLAAINCGGVRKLTHAPCLAVILKVSTLDIVPLALHETELLLSKLNLESTWLISGTIGSSEGKRVWLVQCPEKIKSNQARLKHRIESLLGRRIILVEILDENLEVLSLGLIALLLLLLTLLGCDLLVFNSLNTPRRSSR